MKKLLCILTCAVMAVTLFACGSTGGTSASTSERASVPESTSESASGGSGGTVVKPVDNKTYQSWWFRQADYKTMPICAFNAAPPRTGSYASSLITDEHYAAMKEAGFNAAYALYDNVTSFGDDVATALELAEKYKISYVAGAPGFNTANDANILETQIYKALIKNSPKALGGVEIMDEPSYVNMNALSESRKTFEGILGKKMLYHVNLFPDYANQKQLYNRGDDDGYPIPEEGYSYEQYVSDYVRIYNPQILSYDYYPCRSNGSMSKGYFGNMSVIRRTALEAQIPFWVYIQTCSFGGGVRIPNEADLFWLVNTSLAYGCKGIQYFTYTLPMSSGGEVFDGALIDRSGNKTELWYSAKKINNFVLDIDEVLMCCISKGVMTAGESACPVPEDDVVESYGNLVSVGGESVIVGCFDYKGADAFYVVNSNHLDSTGATLTFGDSVKGYTVDMDGKKEFDSSSLDLTLSAGCATLVVLET